MNSTFTLTSRNQALSSGEIGNSSAPVPMTTTSGRGISNLTNANAFGVMSLISSTFHKVENRGSISTEPVTRTPDIVKEDDPSASITALLLLSGPNASADRSIPRESKGDDGLALVRSGACCAVAAPAFFGDEPVARLRCRVRDRCRAYRTPTIAIVEMQTVQALRQGQLRNVARFKRP